MTTTNALTAEQKMAILNGLKVVEFDTREDEFSVHVADDETTIAALKQIGLDENDIEQTYVDGEVRDITLVGFKCGADCHDGRAFCIWSAEEKLDMLNELDFIDHECDGEVCYYVLVECDTKTQDTLDALGFDAEEFLNDDDQIDVSQIAWQIGAAWWDGTKFNVDKPDPIGGGRPAENQPPENMPA